MPSALTSWLQNYNPDGSRRPGANPGNAAYEQWKAQAQSFKVRQLPGARAAEAQSGRLPPPAQAVAARAESPLNSPQQAMAIGEPIPVIVARRRNGAGGVLVFPRATEAAFSNTSTTVTASYHCVLGEGPMGSVQVRDVRNGACRIGSFSQNYGTRAGSWSPGNTATAQTAYTVPTFPQGCGGGGNYAGLSTIEFSATTPGGTDDWRIGWNAFVRDGLQLTRLLDSTSGATDNIADLVLWALQRSGRVPAAMIDTPSLLTATRFCDVNGLLCNGEFKDSANLGDWLIRLLPYFLLRETKVAGKFGLRPLVPFDAATGAITTTAITPEWVLSEDVIVPGSFAQEWSDAGTRLAPVLTMLWRQQASETDVPLVRSLQVGLARSESGPFEQHDLSQFAATELHAARVGAYLHGRRYLSTHTASLQLRPGSQSGLIVEGDVVQVRLGLITGREPDALLSEWYVVESVGQARDGTESLQLSHFPVDAQGRSLLALLVANVTTPGALLPTPALGSCDVAGRSSDTSVPASSTSGTPFSSGGSGITGGAGPAAPFDAIKLPDYGASERAAPTSTNGTPAVGGGLPGEPPADVPIGGSVPAEYLNKINAAIEAALPGVPTTWYVMPGDGTWQSASAVFRISGGGYSYSDNISGGGTVGDANTLFTVNFTYPAGPLISISGGDVYLGTYAGQAAQIVNAAALDTLQGTFYGGVFAWSPVSYTITAGPTKQTIKMVSWTRTG